MKTLLVIAMLCAGCFSSARRAVVETPDPKVGDLHCEAPPMSAVEMLYYIPGPSDCAAR